ncbi:MAG: hypothetical protein AAGG07_12705 [Planctomycetota bacterium]
MKQLLASLCVCTVAGTAAGAMLEIQQVYRIDPFNPDFNQSVQFSAVVDTASLTGQGVELLPIVANFVNVTLENPFRVAFGRVPTNVSPYEDLPGNLRAEFINGVFSDNIIQIDNPATTATDWQILRDDDGNSGGVFFIGPEFAFWGVDVLSTSRHRIESSTITPTPGSTLLLATAGLFAARRRR